MAWARTTAGPLSCTSGRLSDNRPGDRSRARSESKIREVRLQRRHKVRAAVDDSCIAVDLKRHGDAVIGIMAQAGNVRGNPAAMPVDAAAWRCRVNCNACAVEGVWRLRSHRYAVEKAIEIGGVHYQTAEQCVPPAHEIPGGGSESASSPFHTRIPDQPTSGIRGALGQAEGIARDGVADSQTGDFRPIRGHRARQAERADEQLLDDFVISPPGDFLD